MPYNGYCRGTGRNALGKRWLNAFVLLILAEDSTHGYEIAQKLGEFGFSIQTTGQMGSLYRLLSDLESAELIEADWITDQPGPAKKKYRITGKGIEELKNQSDAFDAVRERIDVFQQRVQALQDK
ncbi:MAG TPA: PadR family transcriptional regulator [Thermotogota bacterium]|nr:PadR family transcriptional regulator [Thermotogota bacterium]HPJ88965.1 PadR family transcriptional regulator [Thermotogota bacterium]HPR95897.1 PadR family transcriptional regulator [Thermotogota bacterium]